MLLIYSAKLMRCVSFFYSNVDICVVLGLEFAVVCVVEVNLLQVIERRSDACTRH